MSDNQAKTEDAMLPGKIIYGLYGAGFIFGLTAIAGVIFAYVSRDENEVLDTHLKYQIDMFWVGLVAIIVGIVLAFIGIGFLILFAWLVWAVLRIVSGLILIIEDKPITEVKYLYSFAK